MAPWPTTAGVRGLFDLSIGKILVLGIIGLVVFGPDQLPRIAAQAGRALRDLRRLADRARADLADNLGPEFHDFDLNDLNRLRMSVEEMGDLPVPNVTPDDAFSVTEGVT